MQFGGVGGMNPSMGMGGMNPAMGGMGGMNPGMTGMGGMGGMGGMNPAMGGIGGMNPGMAGMGGMGGMNPAMGGMNPGMTGIGGMGGMNPAMGGMNPGMMGFGGMNPGMMGFGGMNPGMMGFGGMNPGMVSPQPQQTADTNISIEDQSGWNLIFENQNDKKSLTIRISEQKLVKEAISMYMIKSGRTDKCKFIFNNKELYQEMKICQSGLNNLSRILVISTKNVIGAI